MTNPRLTAALAQHQRHEWGQHDGWWECTCDRNQPYTPDHLADVITSLEGVAVVETPTESWEQLHGRSFGTEVSTYKDRVLIGCDLDISADYARQLAAALLAAADHVDHLARAAEGGR